MSAWDVVESVGSLAFNVMGVGTLVNGAAALGHGAYGAVESARGHDAEAREQYGQATVKGLEAMPGLGLLASAANCYDRISDGDSDIGGGILDSIFGPAGDEEKEKRRQSVFEMEEMAGKTPQERYELAIKLVAKDIAAQGMDFSGDGAMKGNMEMWEGLKEGGGMKVKPGVDPSEAMQDFLKNSAGYKLDCGMGVQMMQLAAMYEAMGPDGFDEMMKKGGGCSVKVGGTRGALASMSRMHREDADALDTTRPPALTEDKVDANGDWLDGASRPGDSIYFDNRGASPEDKKGGYGGENALYLGEENGKRMYFAHPFGVVTEEQIFANLTKHNTDPTGTPVTRMEELYRPKLPKR